MLEKDETVIEVRIKGGKVIKEALLSQPLKDH
jgi:hypothetical protein